MIGSSMWRGLIAGAALIVGVGPLEAACTGHKVAVQGTGLSIWTTTSFNPFSGVELRTHGAISVKNNDTNAVCTGIYLTFQEVSSPGELNGSSGGTIPFKITTSNGSTQLIGDTTGIAVGPMAIGGGAGDTVIVNFDFVINAVTGTVPAPGTYSRNDINLVLLDAPSGNTLDNLRNLSVSTLVDTLLDINIDSAGYIPGSLAAYTMDFGNLAIGASKSVGVTIRSNVDHHVDIASDNNGVMKGPVPGSSETHHVSYAASFGGTSLNLVSPATMSLGSKTGTSGTLRAFRVQITDISKARAGSYKDVITLTLAAGL